MGHWTKVIQGDACPRILISALPLIDAANVLLLLTPLLRVMSRISSSRRQRRRQREWPRSRFARIRIRYASRCGINRRLSLLLSFQTSCTCRRCPRCFKREDNICKISRDGLRELCTLGNVNRVLGASRIVNSWKIYSSPRGANTRDGVVNNRGPLRFMYFNAPLPRQNHVPAMPSSRIYCRCFDFHRSRSCGT